jgi:transcriptional regulator with PAS, ATPase and Fis domain
VATFKPKSTLTAHELTVLLGLPRTRSQALAIIRQAIEAERGNAVRAAKRLGVSHRSLMRWRVRFPEVQTMLDQARLIPKDRDLV